MQERQIDPGMEAQAQRRNNLSPYPGTVWRHYKGGLYQVLSTAVHEATHEIFVVYSDMEARGHDVVWCRPLSEWDALVGFGQDRRYRQVEPTHCPVCNDSRFEAYGDARRCCGCLKVS